MKYQIIDGNNLMHRLVHTDPYPLKSFMYAVHGAQYPIIVWDGYNALAERRKIYPEYKVNRNSKPKDPITYESMDIARRICENLECIQVRVDGFEADDVIAHMVDLLGKDNVTYIHSNDIDLAGFGIPTLYTKPVPDHLKLYKTLVGKSSDNVKGLRLFGPKAWEKLEDWEKNNIKFLLSGVNCFNLTISPLGTNITPSLVSDDKLKDKLLDNLDNLKKLWQISNFLPIPQEALDEGTIKGTENMQEIEMIRSQYLLWNV